MSDAATERELLALIHAPLADPAALQAHAGAVRNVIDGSGLPFVTRCELHDRLVKRLREVEAARPV